MGEITSQDRGESAPSPRESSVGGRNMANGDADSRRAFLPLSRLSLGMCELACIFWFTSWPAWIPVGEGFPNCVSARLNLVTHELRFLSHHRHSMLLLTETDDAFGRTEWHERSDGHFCGFSMIPLDATGNPTGVGVQISRDSVGWKFPYLLMVGLWGIAFYKSRRGFRFGVMDLIDTMTLLAVTIALIQWKHVFPLALLLNLATLLLVCMLGVNLARLIWRTPNMWWPLVIEDVAAGPAPADAADEESHP
jgi:hypothetical protein